MKLTRDDLELTLKEVKNQRVQTEIQLLLVEAGIVEIEEKLKAMPKNDIKNPITN